MSIYKKYIDGFSGKRIVVYGDVMLDRYLIGDVGRISPEAPVPVVDLKKERLVAGGAANVAANIAGLGAKASLIGIVGDDREAGDLKKLLGSLKISVEGLNQSRDRITTVKSRILSGSHQIARVDREDVKEVSDEDSIFVTEMFLNLATETDVLVISDYGKGAAEPRTVARLITIARTNGIPVLVDPKGLDYSKYEGSSVLTPNKKEALEFFHSANRKEGEVEEAGSYILEHLEVDNLLVTLGSDGIAVFENSRESVILPASARNVFDVTGAGDTVIGTLAVSLAAGADLVMAASIANFAAGEVVGKVGTTPISIGNLLSALKEASFGESQAV